MNGAVTLLPMHFKMECANCGARTATLKLCVLHHLVSKVFAATELDPLIVSPYKFMEYAYERLRRGGECRYFSQASPVAGLRLYRRRKLSCI
jgi:hypothetical protein